MLKPYSRADVEFQLGDEIGQEGRNSNVYLAHDPQLEAVLVIKRVSKASLDSANFFSESACVYASNHTNVVPIHYACQDATHIFLAMPHYVNGSLKRLMDQRFLTVREVVVLATQFLSGLHHIHSKKLVHFDIKPDNILISERGEALVADFGLAKARGISGLADQDRMYGKMAPPEAFQAGVGFDQRFDIYQVGVTLFRMVAGDAAFYRQHNSYVVNGEFDRNAFKHAVISGQFPNTDNAVFPEHIPDSLIRVIRRCLSPIEDRYQSVIQVVNELAVLDGELLDWQYEEREGARVWTKNKGDMEYSLSLDGSRESLAKKRNWKGREWRIAEYSQPTLNRQLTKRFLREN